MGSSYLPLLCRRWTLVTPVNGMWALLSAVCHLLVVSTSPRSSFSLDCNASTISLASLPCPKRAIGASPQFTCTGAIL